MKRFLRHTLFLAICAPCTALAAEPTPWRQYADVTEAGWSAEKLTAAREYARKLGSGAVFVVHRGNVLAAWGEIERRFRCHSVRKSLVSALFGIYVGEGKIDLNKTLRDLNIDDREALTEEEKNARVVDLLCARSGVYHPAAKEPDDMQQNRPDRGSHAPGTHWWYNNWDFNTLGVIFEQETGRDLIDEFTARLAIPLGMEDFRPRDAYEQLEPGKSIHPAHDFRMSARDLASIGQLFLQQGKWGGQQLVPQAWIAESTTARSPAGDASGYAYMWWTKDAEKPDPDSRTPLTDACRGYAARGAGGHFMLVLPDWDLVFVHRADTDNDHDIAGRNIFRMLEMILAAKVGEPAAAPALTAVTPHRFPNARPAPKEYEAVVVAPELLKKHVGTYQLPPDWDARIFVYQDRLFVDAKGFGEAEIFPLSPTEFFLRADDTQLTFVADETGKTTAMNVTREGKTTLVPRVAVE